MVNLLVLGDAVDDNNTLVGFFGYSLSSHSVVRKLFYEIDDNMHERVKKILASMPLKGIMKNETVTQHVAIAVGDDKSPYYNMYDSFGKEYVLSCGGYHNIKDKSKVPIINVSRVTSQSVQVQSLTELVKTLNSRSKLGRSPSGRYYVVKGENSTNKGIGFECDLDYFRAFCQMADAWAPPANVCEVKCSVMHVPQSAVFDFYTIKNIAVPASVCAITGIFIAQNTKQVVFEPYVGDGRTIGWRDICFMVIGSACSLDLFDLSGRNMSTLDIMRLFDFNDYGAHFSIRVLKLPRTLKELDCTPQSRVTMHFDEVWVSESTAVDGHVLSVATHINYYKD